MYTLLTFFVVIGVIVFIHELGHFLAAIMCGMRVDIFSLGFGKKLVSFKHKKTEYRISLIPLGGYVKIAGMVDESLDPEGGIKGEDDEFESKNIFQKMFVISAGVIMNMILAIAIYSALNYTNGSWIPTSTKINDISKDLPANLAGIQTDDVIIQVNNKTTNTWQEVSKIIKEHPDTTIYVTILRKNKQMRLKVKTISQMVIKDWSLSKSGIIGIIPYTEHQEISFITALKKGIATTGNWLKVSIVSLKMLITGEASLKNLGGALLIAEMSEKSARAGLNSFLSFLAMISINIGFLNILPIPALDGGHLTYIMIEGITRRKIKTDIKIRIQQIGIFCLMLLMTIAIFNDIYRIME